MKKVKRPGQERRSIRDLWSDFPHKERNKLVSRLYPNFAVESLDQVQRKKKCPESNEGPVE